MKTNSIFLDHVTYLNEEDKHNLEKGAFKSILVIGENAAHFKKEFTDYQYMCINFDDLDHASTALRTALSEEGFLPEAIMIDLEINTDELNKFFNMLKKSALFRHIPLFLFTHHLNPEDLEKYLKMPFFDDIYTPNSSPKEIVERISFLKKYKAKIKQTSEEECVTLLNNKYTFDINYCLKRIGDIIVSGTLILLLSPIFIIIGAIVALESRGPVVYRAKRAGRGYQVFKFYKFRSMYSNADKMIKNLEHLNQYSDNESNTAKFYKISNDPRVTKVGAFLRNTSLDELPQLFNVLKGDMSIVGNRPLPLYEANTITTDSYSSRFLAPAGITGLWQVNKRGKKDMSTDERLNLDISYAQQWSFMSDLKIIMKTPKALLQKDNV